MQTAYSGSSEFVDESKSNPSSVEDDVDLKEQMLSDKLAEHLSLQFGGDNQSNEENAFDARKERKKKSVHFVESCQSSSVSTNSVDSWTDDNIDSTTPRKVGYRVTFEIISAKTTSQRSSGPKKKYVAYTILVKRTPGLETHPGVIERRYTDFLNLYISLRKRFPSLLNDFPFPKKTIVGNFSPEVITERSVAFQHLLALCLSVTEMRRTQEFHDFLYNRELKEARRLMKSAQFEESSNILENVYYIQEKLLLHDSEFNSSVFRTLCVLIASLNAVNNVNEAQEYAEKALQIASKYNTSLNDLLAAVIVLSKKLFWSLEKQRKLLDTKLDELKQKGVIVDKLPTLLEIVMQKDLTCSAF